MKKTFKKLSLMLALSLIVLTFCGCSLLSYFFPPYDVNQYAEVITQSALGYLQNAFVDELTDEQMIQAAVNGANTILQTYDGYGYFLTPQQYYDLNNPQPSASDGKYFGFTYMQIKYVGLYVSSLSVDSEAYWRGLKEGDIIIDISQRDGTPLTYTQDGVVKELDVRVADLEILRSRLGEQAGGDTYKFTVLTNATPQMCFEDGEIKTLEIKRGERRNDNVGEDNSMYFVEYYGGKTVGNVSSKTIELRSLELLDGGDIGYIRILEFNEYPKEKIGTADEVKLALDALKAAGKKKIIIDLQGNPGGSVYQVQEVAGYFIKSNSSKVKVATIERRSGITDTYSVSSKYDDYFDGSSGNIVVLTDENSASGSEMLLGAILDYGTGMHVGTTSFGKGIAQSHEPVEGLTGKVIDTTGNEITYNYGIYLTIAYYYSPNHVNIHGIGYTPQEENIIADYLGQMERSIELLGD